MHVIGALVICFVFLVFVGGMFFDELLESWDNHHKRVLKHRERELQLRERELELREREEDLLDWQLHT